MLLPGDVIILQTVKVLKMNAITAHSLKEPSGLTMPIAI